MTFLQLCRNRWSFHRNVSKNFPTGQLIKATGGQLYAHARGVGRAPSPGSGRRGITCWTGNCQSRLSTEEIYRESDKQTKLSFDGPLDHCKDLILGRCWTDIVYKYIYGNCGASSPLPGRMRLLQCFQCGLICWFCTGQLAGKGYCHSLTKK